MSYELGKHPTWRQSEIYREIHRSGEEGITSNQLCQNVFNDPSKKNNLNSHLRNLKKRLGEYAIITNTIQIDGHKEKIFISRRAKIISQVRKNNIDNT